MLNIIEINNFNASELDVYARYTEAQLLNKDRPEDGLFIAESPKVIGRALDAGYIPISVLVEKKQMEEIIERGLGIMRKECYLLHNVDILSNCDFESLMYYHQNSSNINATLLVSPRKTSRYLLFNDDNLLRGWVNKDTMETKPAGLRYKEGEYREYAYSGIQVTTPKILNLLPRGKYSIIDFYLSICHRVDIQCYVEDDLQLLDIGKPENLEKAEEFLSKL